jgi:uncharacterized protein YndB with AHSA1/START domain
MDIEQTITIDAPPERVFRALTDAEELVRWFPSTAESDPRTGGEFVLRFEFEDEAQNHTYSGRHEEVTANERVRYPWNGQFGSVFRMKTATSGASTGAT